MKRMLVTAGSTATHIDKVRVVTNIFGGRTGEHIALKAAEAGWQVMLLSSNPGGESPRPEWVLERRRFKTFDELAELMEIEVREGGYDAIVHSAAVSDYRPAGAYVLGPDGRPVPLATEGPDAAKIPSSHNELFIKLVPTFKIVDRIRKPWGFKGKLVKFKLQVGMTDERLIEIARRSIVQSDADLIVANCLEWSQVRAYVIDRNGGGASVHRVDLPYELLRRLS